MELALDLAIEAADAGEVPIGALVVGPEGLLGKGRNRMEELRDATAHAEMFALREASRSLGQWRLDGLTLFATLEPCPMCAGAIVHCRPERVVFGVADPKGGAAGGWINLLESNPPLNHRCDITSGVLGEECLHLLQSFFREARERKKLERGTDAIEPED